AQDHDHRDRGEHSGLGGLQALLRREPHGGHQRSLLLRREASAWPLSAQPAANAAAAMSPPVSAHLVVTRAVVRRVATRVWSLRGGPPCGWSLVCPPAVCPGVGIAVVTGLVIRVVIRQPPPS